MQTSFTGIRLVAETPNEDWVPKIQWAKGYLQAEELAALNQLPGFDRNEMKLLPVGIPELWVDSGPHVSIMNCPPKGTPTKDASGIVDDLGSAQQHLQQLKIDQFEIDFSEATIGYLLGSKGLDDTVNGPVSVVQVLGPAARNQVNDLRKRLSLGPFHEDHSVHLTLAKLTGCMGSHAEFRTKLIAGWPHNETGMPLMIKDLPRIQPLPLSEGESPPKAAKK